MLALLALAACAKTPATDGRDASPLAAMDLSQAPSSSADGGAMDDGGGPPACTAQTASCRGDQKPGWQCVKTLDVRLVDEAGAPVVGATPNLCGKNLCLYKATDALGQAHIAACYWLDSPAFKLIGGHDWVSFAAAVPPMEVISLPDTSLTRLPATGADFPAAGKALVVTSGAVSLAITASTSVTFDSLYGDDMKLRAAELKQPPPGVDASLGLELFFGLAPIDTVLDPPAALTVPNRKGWAANSKVELFILGLAAQGTYAPYAGWKSVATGHVTSDGSSITTDAGTGIPQLSIVGIRQH